MKRKIGLHLAVCAFSVGLGGNPGVAHATSATGVIKSVQIRGANFAVIMTPINPSNRPSCQSAGHPYSYAFDISTAKGRALLSTAQAALMSGKTVTITGGTTCTTVQSGMVIETVQAISVGTIFD